MPFAKMQVTSGLLYTKFHVTQGVIQLDKVSQISVYGLFVAFLPVNVQQSWWPSESCSLV